MYKYVKSANWNTLQWEHHDEVNKFRNKRDVYDYTTFKVDGQNFSATIYQIWMGKPVSFGQVTSIHPYDSSEYHWAKFDANGNKVTYLCNGNKVEEESKRVNTDKDVIGIASHLLDLDRQSNIKSRIDHT